ncbi:MAG: T9SS type A sorting domain-containing protein [Bacteroidales bacterium]|nr:T9SS type A sorting domain-containing protein [Bacteroidales bacterium]
MNSITKKAIGYLVIWLCFLPYCSVGQNIKTLSTSDLPWGTYIKGLYQFEIDNNSGKYLKEVNGAIAPAPLNNNNSRFYFWIAENAYTQRFYIYSASQENKILKIASNGSAQMITNNSTNVVPESELYFQMATNGPIRTQQDSLEGIMAIGHITTNNLSSNYGNNDCKCNILQIGNAKYKVHKAENSIPISYLPIKFEKSNISNSLGSINEQNNEATISQLSSGLPQNFVSSNFFVGGFGEDDFKITIEPGTEGTIGFVEYQYHHYSSAVYQEALPKIGLKIKNGKIFLTYLSGIQELPFSDQLLGEEKETDFVFGVPITFGFKEQYVFTASQGNKSYELTDVIPAEIFFNQSITKSARLLVRINEGVLHLSYSPKNRLINSENNFGEDDGSDLVSTNVFFPYNRGNSLINTFNWQNTKWLIRYRSDIGIVSDEIYSPFYAQDLTFSSIAAQFKGGKYSGGEDFSTEEGWELVKANLGYNANGSEANVPPHYPYVLLYNKISSTLRVFVYANNYGEANQLKVSLGIDKGMPGKNSNDPSYIPRLWGSLQQFVSLDKIAPSSYGKSMPFPGIQGRDWYFSDFVMEYDPCISFFSSSLVLSVSKVTNGNMSIIGRLEGGSIPAGTDQYSDWAQNRENFLLGVMDNNFGNLENTLGDITFNQFDKFDLLDFKDTIDGTLVGKDIADWEKEKARLDWKATDKIGQSEIADGSFQVVEGTAKILEGAAKMGGPIGSLFGGSQVEGAAKMVQGAATIGRGISKIAKGDARLDIAYGKKLYYDNIKDKVKHGDQSIKMTVPTPMPHAVFGELALKGTLKIETDLITNEFIATPGGKNSHLAMEWFNNGWYGGQPLYNKPMGNFNLLNQPKFAVGVAQTGSFFSAHLKIKEKPYFAINNTALGKIDDVIMVSIRVETLNNSNKPYVTNTSIGQSYDTYFHTNGKSALPGSIDISELVKWSQIQANINTLSNKSAANIEAHLSKWIRVSYNVWSLTLSNLKSRNLSRVAGNTSQFFKGESSFAYETGFSGKNIADKRFGNYNFGDNSDWGTNYHIYHNQDDFQALMESYCDCRNDEDLVNYPKSAEFEILEPEKHLEKSKPSILSVYPNPANSWVHYSAENRLNGKAEVNLFDLTGRLLINQEAQTNGYQKFQGRLNLDSLKNGIYILKVSLPSGETVTQRIIKK